MKITDNPDLVTFVNNHPAATIAVPIDDSGTLHAAALLYLKSPESLEFFFITSRESEKCTLLRTRKEIPCAAVIGTERDTPFTLQMRGVLQEADPENYEHEVALYYEKRGNHHDDISDPSTCLLKFYPTWARFTDYAKNYARFMLDIDGQS